jgi:hypothetical protein
VARLPCDRQRATVSRIRSGNVVLDLEEDHRHPPPQSRDPLASAIGHQPMPSLMIDRPSLRGCNHHVMAVLNCCHERRQKNVVLSKRRARRLFGGNLGGALRGGGCGTCRSPNRLSKRLVVVQTIHIRSSQLVAFAPVRFAVFLEATTFMS